MAEKKQKEVYSEERFINKEPELNSKNIHDLIESTNKLVNRVDKLVSLFDEASKHVGEVESTEARITALSSKLESLLEQNRAIAQGLVLLEKYVKGKTGLPQQSASVTEYS